MADDGFASVAILGVGLIGGSFGLACSERLPGTRITGFDPDARALDAALEKGAIHKAASSVSDAVAGSDLVVIATHVGAVVEVFSVAVSHLKPGAVVTDVGSTKQVIVRQIEEIVPDGVSFIGGHPVAGSEKQGIEAASASLFEGASWVLTPTARSSERSYRALARLLGTLGARVLSLDPKIHDEALALSSHLPQLISSTLMGFASQVSEGGIPLLAAGGFRDMTRIAESSPELWTDVAKHNRESIIQILTMFIEHLAARNKEIADERWEDLHDALARGVEGRTSMMSAAGTQEELLRLDVHIPNVPGSLAEVTNALGRAGINIEDLEIVHSRQDGRGKLMLLLEGADQREAAAGLLTEQGFEVS